MSGKTTLLRTVGTNLVLAYAGAPVRAGRLVVSSLQPAAGMRVRDSLLEGSSLFYAEIKRLKLVVDLAEGDRPVLFLLDELLSGTNSKDRAAGAGDSWNGGRSGSSPPTTSPSAGSPRSSPRRPRTSTSRTS